MDRVSRQVQIDEVRKALKALTLGALADTLPQRAALARHTRPALLA